MSTILRINEINFKTKLGTEDVLSIVEEFLKNRSEKYEIDKTNILFDTDSHVTHEPVWVVFIISEKIKKRWPDAYVSVKISDKEGRVVYIQNDHGVVIEKY